ncbi:TIGR00303 family protein [Synechococcus sp. Nb3U1]|uniref:nicotinate mononucleotide-dependent phosphoribosyltransferase CobT n=1 Tax=Synechococcus sp. Nb3U1 TaxID=1914529 RepID=UPI001F27F816|nr:TIGR00303 family protein [Synechococcus sp. Nb3U1]
MFPFPCVKAYTQLSLARQWCERVQGSQPLFLACLGFTETALIPGISAAGATPSLRRYTALADGELLLEGYSHRLPTSPDGYPSPVVISRAILTELGIPYRVFNCGLPDPLPGAETVVSGGIARCLSTGQALSVERVGSLWQEGYDRGSHLASGYWVIGECVAGGTTTALALLLGLGWGAEGMVNSSHPVCNHAQKLALVRQGLANLPSGASALEVVAAVGDPMQPFVAGLAMGAAQRGRVLLAGGTQMLAVVALMMRLGVEQGIPWPPENVAVGTTRWVAEDPSGNTVALAQLLGSVPLLATQLSFASSRYAPLQAYERGYVKEGVGAGGLAIASSLHAAWGQGELLAAIERSYETLQAASRGAMVKPS